MLLDYQDTVNKIYEADKGLYMLLYKPIKQWYNDNGVRLESLKDKILALQKEFVEFEIDPDVPDDPNVPNERKPRRMKITEEKSTTIPAKREMKEIPTKWYQKKKLELVVVEPERIEKTPATVIFLEGKTQEDFDKRMKELMETPTEINF